MQLTQLPLGVRALQNIEFPHKLGLMDRVFRRKLERYGICWVPTAAGLDWKLDLTNSTHRWIAYGKYEGPGFHKWAKCAIPQDGVIVDSGANIGQMLLYLAQLIPQGRVFAFEPGVEQADWLAECLKQNSNLPVELIRLGLGSEKSKVLLKDDGNPNTHGGQSFISENAGKPIEVVRLEDELKERKVSKVDLWKLDVEGFEIAALEGASQFLESKVIAAVYAELHEENGYRIKDYLRNLGYNCFSIDNQGQMSPMGVLPEHTNGLFLPV